ncbi:MAG: S8 family serine peptidase [Paludibacteraceae bacterium]|nr:S8 family serine peptidase [Paludibacteraceae bacterium]
MKLLFILSWILGLQPLHEAGYRGEGITIAVIDCGFFGADSAAFFPQDQIVGIYDLIEEEYRSYEITAQSYDNHGTLCMSTMLYESDELHGTAPEAKYILIRTEDLDNEYRGEIDRLAKGIRLADELGADIISISLGYSVFDVPDAIIKFEELDGSSSAAKAATEAARHNRLVCIAAGNEGNKTEYKNITIPGDADSVLTVGAVKEDSTATSFTSYGPIAVDRPKPEISSLGVKIPVFDPVMRGVRTGNGTSFATPMVAGMAACLWQALPHLTAMQLREKIIQSGHLYPNHDIRIGYGIPDAWKIYLSEKKETGLYDLPDLHQREKVLINGQLYIIIDGVRYLPTGQKAG